MGGGKAGRKGGREGGHRTHQHYDDDDDDDRVFFFAQILLHRIAQWEKKIQIKLVASVIIIMLHTFLKVR